jgi:hypothetical protein
MSRVSRVKLGTLSVCGAIGVGAVFLSGWGFDVSSNRTKAVALFEQSHDLSSHLSSFGHVYALGTLLGNSRGVVSPSQYETWSDEMYDVAFGVTNDWNRIAAKKNAVGFLSFVNPDKAMSRFKEIEDPLPQPNGRFPEDVRADGAGPIFVNYWHSGKKPSSPWERLAVIEDEADRVGRTGEYPYVAMGKIIVELAKTPSPESTTAIKRILNQALSFYSHTPYKFRNRNRQFYEFLKLMAQSISDQDWLSQAAKTLVAQLAQTPKDDMAYASEAETSKGITHFNDIRDELRFEAFPLIQRLAPALATQLLQQHSELDKAEDNPTFRSAGFNPPGVESAQSEAMHSRGLQRSLVKEIENDVKKIEDEKNLEHASALLEHASALYARLSDRTIKMEGFAALVPALVKAERGKEATQTYWTYRTQLQELTNDNERLRAMAALAKASNHVNDSTGFSQLTATVLDQGAIMFDEDSRSRPDWSPSGRDGFDEATDLVDFATKSELKSLPDWIQKVESIELKANLLSVEAGDLAKK